MVTLLPIIRLYLKRNGTKRKNEGYTSMVFALVLVLIAFDLYPSYPKSQDQRIFIVHSGTLKIKIPLLKRKEVFVHIHIASKRRVMDCLTLVFGLLRHERTFLYG